MRHFPPYKQRFVCIELNDGDSSSALTVVRQPCGCWCCIMILKLSEVWRTHNKTSKTAAQSWAERTWQMSDSELKRKPPLKNGTEGENNWTKNITSMAAYYFECKEEQCKKLEVPGMAA